ncbi:MAG: hypothetical protein ABIQ88_02380 [Chitinophagaceae bacterium]
MKIFIFFLTACLLFTVAADAQSFVKRLPKPGDIAVQHGRLSNDSGTVIIVPADKTINAFRPITNVAAYAEPGHILMAGAGVAYEHLKYDAKADKWKAEWSIAAVGWAGAPLDGSKTDAVSYGIMFGLANNLIMFGPALNNGKLMGVVSIGINLNN